MELNHVAVFIDNLERSALAPGLGGWKAAPTLISKQPVTVDGRPTEHSGRTRRIRTASDVAFGVSVEDVEPGAPIQPVPGNAWHHVSIWPDDFSAAIRTLEELGYQREVVGRGPTGELEIFAYMTSPFGPRIELGDGVALSRMLASLAAKTQKPAGGVVEGSPDTALAPYEVTTVVPSKADLETLRRCWQEALGAEWGEITDSKVTVSTPAGERELRTHNVSTLGSPCISITAPQAGSTSLLAPVAANGWHHVSFRSSDFARDLASLKAAGFEMEFCDRGQDDQPGSFAMMVSPEGTRVKLAA